MKIYNEIISRFNETTQQWEDVYEDSFEHSGEVMKMIHRLACSNMEICTGAANQCNPDYPADSNNEMQGDGSLSKWSPSSFYENSDVFPPNAGGGFQRRAVCGDGSTHVLYWDDQEANLYNGGSQYPNPNHSCESICAEVVHDVCTGTIVQEYAFQYPDSLDCLTNAETISPYQCPNTTEGCTYNYWEGSGAISKLTGCYDAADSPLVTIQGDNLIVGEWEGWIAISFKNTAASPFISGQEFVLSLGLSGTWGTDWLVWDHTGAYELDTLSGPVDGYINFNYGYIEQEGFDNLPLALTYDKYEAGLSDHSDFYYIAAATPQTITIPIDMVNQIYSTASPAGTNYLTNIIYDISRQTMAGNVSTCDHIEIYSSDVQLEGLADVISNPSMVR